MQYKPVSVIQLQKINNSIAEKYNLEKPTYEMQLPGNNTQIAEYDEDSIKDAPKEDVEKWKKYQEQLELMQAESNERQMAYVLYKGVECDVPEAWLEEQAWLGIKLPEDERDIKVQYISTELLPTAFDLKKAFVDIIKLSMKGADPSAIKAAEDMFLDQV